jgi:anti-sigma B factor antagonist
VTPLQVERTRVDGLDVLVVEGELDIATAPRMISALNEALAERDDPLVVDLSQVLFMDSTGLALLINARRRASARVARSRACSRSRTWSRACAFAPIGRAPGGLPPKP